MSTGRMLGVVVWLLLLLLLAGCNGQTHVNAWSQTGYASCTGLCINAGNVHQTMPQPDADRTLLAAALVAVASLVVVCLALAGAM